MNTLLLRAPTLALTIVATVLLAPSPAHADTSGPAPAFSLMAGSSTMVEIPGTRLPTMTLSAYQGVYLYAKDLHVDMVTPDPPSSPDPGVTTAIRCQGPGLPTMTVYPAGWYWARNFDLPHDTYMAPRLRGLFTAPQTGSYVCSLWISAYVYSGTYEVRVRAGASLNSTFVGSTQVVKAAAGWALPHRPVADQQVIRKGTTIRTLGYTYQPQTSAPYVMVVQDIALTTCARGDSARYTGSVTMSGTGTRVRTYIEILPKQSDGTTACGQRFGSTVQDRVITVPVHHFTATHTMNIPKTQLAGCPRFRTNLVVTAVNDGSSNGNDLIVHSSWTGQGIVPTHGAAYEH